MSEFYTKAEVDALIGELRNEIFATIRNLAGATVGYKVLFEQMATESNAEPPMPEKWSRKFTGVKDDIRARIDRTLYRLLVKDAQLTSGGNISRQIDVILWRYYGKPKLSFEKKDEE